jgi:carboxypeptidase C (cathepsin A)
MIATIPTRGLTQEEKAAAPAPNQASTPEPEPSSWTSSHSITVGAETVAYDAEVGSIILRDDQEKATAELFYTAYFRTNGSDAASRPLIFAYNGGPGSASFWLHMGIMGPRRVVTPIVGQQAPPPYPMEDNQYTLLNQADIVMIDPVGTGFSRPTGEAKGEDFWGLDEDARSLTQFIRRFLSQHGRWNSPRYLLGESYGTTRSAVLARHLQRANIDLNGIVLVSAVLDFNTILFPDGAIMPYILNVPSFAVTAEYLDALPGGKPADLDAFMKEVEDWVLSDYAAALMAGSAVDPGRRAAIIEQMHQYTGLSPE